MMKISRNKIIAAAALVLALAAAYFLGGYPAPDSAGFLAGRGQVATPAADAPSSSAWSEASDKPAPVPAMASDATLPASGPSLSGTNAGLTTAANTDSPPAPSASDSRSDSAASSSDPASAPVSPIASAPPAPADASAANVEQGTAGAGTCTLSVDCATILDNLDRLDPSKAELIPPGGIILAEQEVAFSEGESVFTVLAREMKRRHIHFEFEENPVYNSAYVEGIGNIYEFDCGELSGWTYKINGSFPGCGCSQYILKNGDVVEIVYTCDLGRDIGGYISGVYN